MIRRYAVVSLALLGLVSCSRAPADEVDVGVEETQSALLGSQLSCASDGTCTMNNMPLLWQLDPKIDSDVYDMRAGGCYDTSITTLLTTALANRTTSLPLAGRTLTWNNIQSGIGGDGTTAFKAIKQLSQQYRWAKQSQADQRNHINPPSVQPFYFHEMLNDFGSGNRFPASCDPKVYGSCAWMATSVGRAFRDFTSSLTHVTNSYLTALMRNGFAVLVAYTRYSPKKVWDNSLGGYRMTFTTAPGDFHKVAFSGLQTGSYPLRINDVGNGKRYRVSVSSNMKVRATYDGVAVQDIKKFDFPNGKSSQTFVRYDPSQLAEEKVYFVDHIDGFSLSEGMPSQVFAGTWGTNWTSLMPFTLNGQPRLLAYNAATGHVHFDDIAANAHGSITKWDWTWAAGWTDFVPYYVSGAPYFIAYNRQTGEVHFDQVSPDLQGPIIKRMSSWPAGLTSVVPFTMNGKSYFLRYNASTGAVSIVRVSATGDDATQIWSFTWGPGWAQFAPFTLGGKPYMIVYNATSGLTHIDRVSEQLNGTIMMAEKTLPAGLSVASVAFSGPPYFLTYSASGVAGYHRISLDTKGEGVVWSSANYLPGASSIVPFIQDGKSYHLIYNKVSGAVRSYAVTPF